nr:hypothetical protein CparaKRNrm1_p035 [Cryptomonas paramecium]
MVLSNCPFIIITEQNRFFFLTLKYPRHIKCRRKQNKKIFKCLFQKKKSIFNFYTTWIFDARTTGYYNLKKKIPSKIPFEVKYVSNVRTFYKKNYLVGRFDFRFTCFLFFTIKHAFMNKLYKSKSFQEKIFPYDTYNWQFSQNVIQNLNENTDFIYIFKFFDSKLSTIFIDGNLSVKTHLTVPFCLYKNLISTKYKISCLSLYAEFLSLYVKLSKNLKTNYNFNYFFKVNFNMSLSRTLVYCFFFTSFFFLRVFKFILSHEIVFHSKKKKFNLIKFLLDKNLQMNKQRKNTYFIDSFSFFSIKLNKICLKQLKSMHIKCKKNGYTHVYSYNSTLIFQQKLIERIAEKTWNLKIRFLESLFENFLKKFKKKNQTCWKKKQHDFFRYIKFVILLYIKANMLGKNSFLEKFCLMLFYLTYNFYLCVKLCFSFISWTNVNTNLNEFKSFFLNRTLARRKNRKIMFFQKLILKKHFKYKY